MHVTPRLCPWHKLKGESGGGPNLRSRLHVGPRPVQPLCSRRGKCRGQINYVRKLSPKEVIWPRVSGRIVFDCGLGRQLVWLTRWRNSQETHRWMCRSVSFDSLHLRSDCGQNRRVLPEERYHNSWGRAPAISRIVGLRGRPPRVKSFIRA